MARCPHIYANGFQCIDETFDATERCESHQKVVPFIPVRLKDSWMRKAALRVVAFILLVTLFVIPILYSLKNLYWGAPAQAREVKAG